MESTLTQNYSPAIPAPLSLSCLDTIQAVRQMMRRLASLLKPAEQLTTTQWARKYRRLSPKAAARPGIYDPDLTPWIAGIHEALDDHTVHTVVAMKGAQVAWTDGVLLNYLGRRIDIDPCPMIVMFAKDGAAKNFNDEKFTPMVEVTPRLRKKIPIDRKRDRDNRQEFKGFPGGFLKFVGSNSPASVKSTPAPVVAVEEPDDANENVRDQGDSITLLFERMKTFSRRKGIFGGSPTIKGLSRVEAAYLGSDQRKFFVACHECGEEHVLAWEHVRYTEDESVTHEVHGHAIPASARYVCPHCGALWTDAQKRLNVRSGIWRANAAFHGVAGFWIPEILSGFPGSAMQLLAEKELAAHKALREGDDSKIRAFTNSTCGLPYEYKTELPAADALRERCEDYDEFTVPWGGLRLTMGVDVQHNRLAIILRAWGRGEESWLVYWGEIYGNCLLPTDPVWSGLDTLVDRAYAHASGSTLSVRAVSIDTGDGQTVDASYSWVRRRRAVALACKGVANDAREIYAKPRESIDVDRKQKAWKYGLRPYIVGTTRAKDLLLGVDARGGRIKLSGSGPGRMHWYKGVRADYFDQMLNEIKIPSRNDPRRKTWTLKLGTHNEALDGEILALHAARHTGVHLYQDRHWTAIEQSLRQRSLLEPEGLPVPQEGDDETAMPAPVPAIAPRARVRGNAGWMDGYRR